MSFIVASAISMPRIMWMQIKHALRTQTVYYHATVGNKGWAKWLLCGFFLSKYSFVLCIHAWDTVNKKKKLSLPGLGTLNKTERGCLLGETLRTIWFSARRWHGVQPLYKMTFEPQCQLRVIVFSVLMSKWQAKSEREPQLVLFKSFTMFLVTSDYSCQSSSSRI